MRSLSKAQHRKKRIRRQASRKAARRAERTHVSGHRLRGAVEARSTEDTARNTATEYSLGVG
jgi:hypothetical protein